MTTKVMISPQEFFLFSDFIEEESGITLNINKSYLLEERLSPFLREHHCASFGELYLLAKSPQKWALKDAIVDAMTVNETLWFRDESPYLFLRDCWFPKMAKEIEENKRFDLKVWSAACSTGQEPYSIGMMAHEAARIHGAKGLLDPGRIVVTATDLCSQALEIAKLGKYDNLAMTRGMWPEIDQRYFTGDGTGFKVKDEIRKMVRFRQFNLKTPLSQLGVFDLIFIRNVTIYFSLEFKRNLFHQVSKVLKPGGVLIIGASETMLGISDDFQMHSHERCNYYQVKETTS